MIIAFDKALNLHRRSNTPSRVAILFECNGAENYVTLNVTHTIKSYVTPNRVCQTCVEHNIAQ